MAAPQIFLRDDRGRSFCLGPFSANPHTGNYFAGSFARAAAAVRLRRAVGDALTIRFSVTLLVRSDVL
jgi:hypothetical protein